MTRSSPQSQHHPHHHDGHPSHDVAGADKQSLMQMSAIARAGMAILVVIPLWIVVFWVVSQ